MIKEGATYPKNDLNATPNRISRYSVPTSHFACYVPNCELLHHYRPILLPEFSRSSSHLSRSCKNDGIREKYGH